MPRRRFRSQSKELFGACSRARGVPDSRRGRGGGDTGGEVSALKRRGQWISRGEKDLTKMVILRVVFLETASCSFWPWPG